MDIHFTIVFTMYGTHLNVIGYICILCCFPEISPMPTPPHTATAPIKTEWSSKPNSSSKKNNSRAIVAPVQPTTGARVWPANPPGTEAETAVSTPVTESNDRTETEPPSADVKKDQSTDSTMRDSTTGVVSAIVIGAFVSMVALAVVVYLVHLHPSSSAEETFELEEVTPGSEVVAVRWSTTVVTNKDNAQPQ